MRHLDSFLEPTSPEVEHVEGGPSRLAPQQLRGGGANVRKVSPRVAGFRPARIQDGAHGLAGLDQSLRKPAVAGSWSEEVAGAHNERGQAVAAGGLEASLHLNADLTFARQRVL